MQNAVSMDVYMTIWKEHAILFIDIIRLFFQFLTQEILLFSLFFSNQFVIVGRLNFFTWFFKKKVFELEKERYLMNPIVAVWTSSFGISLNVCISLSYFLVPDQIKIEH